MSQEPRRPWFAPTYIPDGYEETWDDALRNHLNNLSIERKQEGYIVLLDAILATPGVDVILAAAIELGFDQGVEITRYRD